MVSEHASPLAALGGVDAGGQNVHVAELAAALGRRGHRVQVFTRRDDPALPTVVQMAPGVEVVHVAAGPARHVPKDGLARWMPDFADDLARRWADPWSRPDLVHAHFWMSGIAALRAGRATSVPVVVTFHALGSVKRRHHGPRDTSPAQRTEVEARLAREVDAVVATCTDEVSELFDLVDPASYGEADRLAERLHVVPCGVDVDRFTPGGPRALPPVAAGTGPGDQGRVPGRGAGVATRAAPRAPGGAPLRHRLLSVSRLVERKGVGTVVRALAALPTAELVVVGGPEVDELARDAEAVRLRALAEECGVGDRVHLVGRVAHQHLPALMRSADVVVATPWYEPFGIVPLEAMACGVPVVGSAVGGLLDTVEPGVTGDLVPARDPAALAAAVAPLLADPALAERYGCAARRRVERLFGWGSVAEATEDAYGRVLGCLGRTARPGVPPGTATSLEAM